MRRLWKRTRELWRRVRVWIRSKGQWCQACQLDSIHVAHTCPAKKTFTSYRDGRKRLVQFGKVVDEGGESTLVVKARPRLRAAPDLQQKNHSG